MFLDPNDDGLVLPLLRQTLSPPSDRVENYKGMDYYYHLSINVVFVGLPWLRWSPSGGNGQSTYNQTHGVTRSLGPTVLVHPTPISFISHSPFPVPPTYRESWTTSTTLTWDCVIGRTDFLQNLLSLIPDGKELLSRCSTWIKPSVRLDSRCSPPDIVCETHGVWCKGSN